MKSELIREFKEEAEKTRKILLRVPTDKFDWQPHEKNSSFRALAQHIANVPSWVGATLKHDELDFANPMPKNEPAADNDALMAFFEMRNTEALKVLEEMDEAELKRDWTMRMGEQIFFTKPKGDVLREFVFNHIVHHRGQLSLYLRMLDIPVPALYGPTADER